MQETLIDRTWIIRFTIALVVAIAASVLSVEIINPNEYMMVEALNFLMMAVFGFTACTLCYVAFGSWKMDGHLSVATLLLLSFALVDVGHFGQIQTFWVVRMIEDARSVDSYNSSVVNFANFVWRFPIIFGHLLIFAFLGIASRRVWLPIITMLFSSFWILGLLISEYV